MKLGFIGLGNMGSRIAKRLLDHGYQLTAYDLDAAKAQALPHKAASLRRAFLNWRRIRCSSHLPHQR